MIYEINILLMFIAFVFTITLLDKKEGFRPFPIDPHHNSGFIPYVPQDVICLIMDAAGVKIYRLGVLKEKCRGEQELKPDDSNICRI